MIEKVEVQSDSNTGRGGIDEMNKCSSSRNVLIGAVDLIAVKCIPRLDPAPRFGFLIPRMTCLKR
jgi:hypothetical protein